MTTDIILAHIITASLFVMLTYSVFKQNQLFKILVDVLIAILTCISVVAAIWGVGTFVGYWFSAFSH